MPLCLQAQKEANIWYFGEGAGIDFNTEPPVALLTGKINTSEGCASIADSSGNLLFYTDGITIWNSEHDTMVNGIGLYGHRSSTQSALIVRKPLSWRFYYIFTSDALDNQNDKGVNYSLVDMYADLGKGAVIIKNQFLFSGSSEKLSAVEHENKIDVWIASSQKNSDSFFVFRLTDMGIIPHVYNSAIVQSAVRNGQLKFSTDAKQIAYTGDRLICLMDFDNNTGGISNYKKIYLNCNPYGIEFSPNGDFLYISCDKLYQCPLMNIHSNVHLDSVCSIIQDMSLGALQIAPNGKIYAAPKSDTFIPVINDPDSNGLKCNFDSIGFNVINQCNIGLPSFVQSSIYKPYLTSYNHCFGDSTEIILKNSSADSVFWDYGDGGTAFTVGASTKHIYPDSGTYPVQAVAYKNGKTDTFNYSLAVHKIIFVGLGNDSLLCKGDSLFLNVYDPSITSYTWNTGSTDSVFNVSTPGTYWVKAENEACVVYDTLEIKTTPCDFDVQNLCFGDTAEIHFPGLQADSVLWDFGDGEKLTSADSFLYHRFQTSGSVAISATVFSGPVNRLVGKIIYITPVPQPDLGNDTTLCEEDILHLDIYKPEYTSYLWNNGSDTSVFTITDTGAYWVQVEIGNCQAFDTLKVDYAPRPTVYIGPDSTFCGLVDYHLEPTTNAGKYKWNTGDTTKSLYINKDGTYSLLVTGDRLCQNADTVIIFKVNYPNGIGTKDTIVCNDFAILDAGNPGSQYVWSTGETSRQITVTQTGIYYVQISAGICSISDTLKVSITAPEDCVPMMYVPNAFSPNGDGRNDFFGPKALNITSVSMIIYNRWGEKIFAGTDANALWDGNYKGEPAPMGVYYFLIDYKFPKDGRQLREHQNGSFHLIR